MCLPRFRESKFLFRQNSDLLDAYPNLVNPSEGHLLQVQPNTLKKSHLNAQKGPLLNMILLEQEGRQDDIQRSLTNFFLLHYYFLNATILKSLWSLKKVQCFLFFIQISALKIKETVIQVSGTFTGEVLMCHDFEG